MSDKLPERQRWVDVLKGITILCVVLAHVIEGFEKSGFRYDGVVEINIVKGISIFHMPLFFSISGYVFALAYLSCQNVGGIQINRVRQYRNQIYNLVFLYFVFSILMFGFKYVFRNYINNPVEWIDLLKLPIKSLPDTPYWYLYVLAVLYVLAALLLRQNWNKNLILGISFILCMLYSVLQVKEIITIQKTLYYSFFFILGCSFIINEASILKGHYLQKCILIIFLVWIVLYKNDILPKFAISILQIFISIFVINILFEISEKYWNQRGLFSFFWEKSLEIYILHVYVTAGIRPILKICHVENYWFAVIMATFLGIALPIILSYILKKLKLWDLLFKPVKYFAKYQTS